MRAAETKYSAGFDGKTFYYQSGTERTTLLDPEKSAMTQEVQEALLRHLSALGGGEEAMGASLALFCCLSRRSALSKGAGQAPEILFLGAGHQHLPAHLATLLRMMQPAAFSRIVVASTDELSAGDAAVPELLHVAPKQIPLPAWGYDACFLLDDGTQDAASVAQALRLVRAGGAVFCVTGRQSVFDAAKRAAGGMVYPITQHAICFVGQMAADGKLQAREDAPPLPPAPVRTMVFLPYKAAMWDCLESIWRAAAADPSTRAYVVPIPFAEKNPDGTVRDWQYEGGRLPEGVPVVDWREIDFAALHPDAVFIHNPFDDCNNVTTVDARYYTTELKKITRKLIYVPYYATGGWIYPELVTPPGYQTADHVIVENDADRAKFEQFYPAPPVPPGKFWALGSPKFDKVRTDRREDYPLPEAWAQLLAGKKAVLYNTTLVAALQNTVHFLPKLQWVLEQFRAAGDIVLWWRPHPLLLPTLHSMRPELAAVYEQLVADYRAQGWFIYDDTPDLHRAIAWTDAYYGDYGSMIWLMQAAGKPALAQNYGIHDGF